MTAKNVNIWQSFNNILKNFQKKDDGLIFGKNSIFMLF